MSTPEAIRNKYMPKISCPNDHMSIKINTNELLKKSKLEAKQVFGMIFAGIENIIRTTEWDENTIRYTILSSANTTSVQQLIAYRLAYLMGELF